MTAKTSLDHARAIVIKTIVTHSVTYFVAGVTAFVVFDYPSLLTETPLRFTMRPLSDPLVMAGPLLQPVRGLLFGLVFYTLREAFFRSPRGWMRLWLVLVVVGILGTFGAPPGSLEGLIYTTLPVPLHLILLPEILIQSLLLSWILFEWVVRPRRWLNWIMGVAFVLVLLLPALGLLAGAQQ